MPFLDVDTELEDAIRLVTPEFASSLKRRFTNVGISEEMRSTQTGRPSITFEDVAFSDERSQITLNNLIIQKLPVARMNEIIPNLLEKNLRISVDWYNVTIKGSYETINTSQLLPIPIKNCGHITINLETIKAKGLVGFALSKDALKTTNFDLDFIIDDVNLTIDYFDCETKLYAKSLATKEHIDSTFVKYLKRELYWKLQETLRTRLNHVLLDFSVSEIFDDDTEISEKYVKHGIDLDIVLNRIIDDFLIGVKGLITSHGYSTFDVPDFRKDFSKRFGLITFWGSFEAKNGTIYDLSRIKRTADFSFASNSETDDITIFGLIGLEELKLHYNRYHAHVWNIGPWGDLKASCGDNSLNFKVIAKIRDLSKLDISLNEFSIKIVQFENVKVEATGMSRALNWLLSYIITWITGNFKQDLIGTIEKQLTNFLKRCVPTQYSRR